MTRILAHEGNPRTNSLVVAGTLDGEVVITVEGGNPVPQAPVEPPPEPVVNKTQRTMVCPGVFAWNDNRGDPFIEGMTQKYLEAQDFFGINVPYIIGIHDNNMVMTCNSTKDCYGVIYFPMFLAGSVTTAPAPLYTTIMQAAWLGVTGSPRAGICAAIIDPDNDPDSISLVGLVTDWGAGTTGLYYWPPGSSIGSFDEAAVAGLASFTPSTGNSYRILRNWDEIDGAYVTASVRDSDGFVVWGSASHTLPANTASNQNLGFIVVGGGDGVAVFGGNGATSYAFGQPNLIQMYYQQTNGIP